MQLRSLTLVQPRSTSRRPWQGMASKAFNLKGYVAYLHYLLKPSAKKLLCDLDRDPWTFPRSVKTDQIMALCNKDTPQMDARNGVPIPGAGRGRKRSLRKVDSAECSTVLHLIPAVKGELSPTSFTVTSPQRQAEASLKDVRSVVHSAAFQP